MSQSHRLGRVVSDLSHSNSRSVTTDHSLHHQSASATTTSHNVGKQAKQRLSLLISSVIAWTRSGGETGGSREKNGSSRNRKQQQANGESGTGGRRRRGGGLEIVLAVRKYVAMVEQLFTSSSSYSASSSSRPDADTRLRDGRRPHTFTSAARHVTAGGNGNAAHAQSSSSSKRHSRGRRLSSAPASLRGSPATSGHLCYVGDSVTKQASMSTSSSEVSTMEELQSAIQAAIAHCKNSVAAAATAASSVNVEAVVARASLRA